MAFFVLRCLELHRGRLKWRWTGIVWRLFTHMFGAWTGMVWRLSPAVIVAGLPVHVTWAASQRSSLRVVGLLTRGSGLQELVSLWVRKELYGLLWPSVGSQARFWIEVLMCLPRFKGRSYSPHFRMDGISKNMWPCFKTSTPDLLFRNLDILVFHCIFSTPLSYISH